MAAADYRRHDMDDRSRALPSPPLWQRGSGKEEDQEVVAWPRAAARHCHLLSRPTRSLYLTLAPYLVTTYPSVTGILGGLCCISGGQGGVRRKVS